MARPVRGVPMDGKLVYSWNHRMILDLNISISNLLYTTKFFGGFDQLDLLTSVKPIGGFRFLMQISVVGFSTIWDFLRLYLWEIFCIILAFIV